ncbi:MAG: Uncharacterized UPF0118 membrane protein, partial [uncultured Acetobacteraceae bacterium]
ATGQLHPRQGTGPGRRAGRRLRAGGRVLPCVAALSVGAAVGRDPRVLHVAGLQAAARKGRLLRRLGRPRHGFGRVPPHRRALGLRHAEAHGRRRRLARFGGSAAHPRHAGPQRLARALAIRGAIPRVLGGRVRLRLHGLVRSRPTLRGEHRPGAALGAARRPVRHRRGLPGAVPRLLLLPRRPGDRRAGRGVAVPLGRDTRAPAHGPHRRRDPRRGFRPPRDRARPGPDDGVRAVAQRRAAPRAARRGRRRDLHPARRGADHLDTGDALAVQRRPDLLGHLPRPLRRLRHQQRGQLHPALAHLPRGGPAAAADLARRSRRRLRLRFPRPLPRPGPARRGLHAAQGLGDRGRRGRTARRRDTSTTLGRAL